MSYQIETHVYLDFDVANNALWLQEWAESDSIERKMSSFQRAIARLGDFPYLGSPRDDVTRGLRVLPVGERGVVTYLVREREQVVFILSVTYGGADWITRSLARFADQ